MSDALPVFTSRTAAMVRRAVTVVVFLIAACSFAFGFGNGWQLGVSLGVPGWIAPLVAPAVDLSVVALLAAMQFLRSHGVGGRLAGPRLLLVVCGAITFALNTARPILADQPGRACFDAVAPLLLIGWSEVGPRLIALLYQAVPDEAGTVPDRVPSLGHTTGSRPGPSPELMQRARQLSTEYRAQYGRSITRDVLRRELHVSNGMAGELLRRVRTPPV